MRSQGFSARRAFRAGVAGAAAVFMAVALSAASASVHSDGDKAVAADDVYHSENVRQVANIPKRSPLADFGSDLAFWDDYAIQGHYDGFTIYDISQPRRPQIVSQVLCPGGQGDVSVTPDGSLLFMSVDYERTDDSCNSEPTGSTDENAWEGMRVFDISNKLSPDYVSAVRTGCGSHTHTLVPDNAGESTYLYVSSYGPAESFPNCQPPHDSISIIEVPHDDPAAASVVATPNLFPKGGAPGTSGCHDITAYPERDVAAGACMGEGILMDISDPVDPQVIDRVRDRNFAFFHSATFSNHGTKVVLTDELGGGGAPTCNREVGPKHGADAVFDIAGAGDSRELVFRSYYKIPRFQEDTENCVAHNGALIPVRGRDVMVQAWYQGGVSMWDFTNSSKPREIGYWERGPLSEQNLVIGGSWSAYYYNGFVYSSDIVKGLDVLDIRGLPGAKRVRWDVFNAQTQYRYPEGGVLSDSTPGPSAAENGGRDMAGTPVILPGEPGGTARVVSQSSPSAMTLAEDSARAEQANGADRRFVRMMIPHHYQAIVMSRLAPARSADRRLRALADRIRVEQSVEIDGMQGWQGRQGLPVTDAQESYQRMLDDPEMLEHMGMATRQEIAKLRAAEGRRFDRLFLRLMIPHHEGAIHMAEDVAGSGSDLYVRQLSTDMIATQGRQVHEMRQMQEN